MGDQESGSGGHGLKRQLVRSLSCQKKTLFRPCFKFLLLLCLVLFIFCYSSSLSGLNGLSLQKHYQRFVSLKNKVISLPRHQVHPKHRATTNANTASTTMPPTVPLTVPTTASTTIPPTVPPTVPLTLPPVSTEYHQAYARNYRFIMDNTEVCKTKTPFLVLMVPVAPHNVKARDAIRQTWAKENVVQGEVVLTLFMLGSTGGADAKLVQEKLKQENLQHHDLIQSGFMDTYLNLTIKTMVIMDWLATRCPNAAYAMKIDSDMFLNIDNLVIMLQKPNIPKEKYLTGYLMVDRPVVRSKDSKWYVSEELYPESTYPPYTLGMGYVFSNDLPEKFVDVSKLIKPFNIEDAYIGMCMKKLGFRLTSLPDPSQFKAYNSAYNRCEFSKVITYILGSSEELVKYWTDLKKPGPPCG